MKIEGLILTPINYISLYGLDMHLSNNSWGPESNLSVEVLKEYWDAVSKLENMLTCHGVKRDHEAQAMHKHLR